MKKKLIIVAVGALVVCGLLLSSVVLAGVGKTSNGNSGFQVNGPHYNLNIIGAKTVGDVDNGNSMGHTMFVDLYGKTKIIMTQGDEFKVVDRCGVEEKRAETEFMIAPGHYNVYARALGKPGGYVNITANGTFEDKAVGEKLILLGFVSINRTTGKPKSVNINELFYVDVTLCIAVDPVTGECIEEVVYKDYWVFDIDELIEYYWDYDNHGLKLLQVRFYECTLVTSEELKSGDYPKDYCRWEDSSPIVSKKDGAIAA